MINITGENFNILAKANEIIHGLENITYIEGGELIKIKNIYNSINELLFKDLNIITSKNKVHNITIPLKFNKENTVYAIELNEGKYFVINEPFKINYITIETDIDNVNSIIYTIESDHYIRSREEKDLFLTKEKAQARCNELNKERITIDLKDIDIPKDFRNSKPSIDKIKRKLDYYKNNNKFDKDIIIDRDRVLQDGYITYLLCKMFNVNNIDVIVQDIKSNIKNDTVPTTPKKKRPRPGFY